MELTCPTQSALYTHTHTHTHTHLHNQEIGVAVVCAVSSHANTTNLGDGWVHSDLPAQRRADIHGWSRSLVAHMSQRGWQAELSIAPRRLHGLRPVSGAQAEAAALRAALRPAHTASACLLHALHQVHMHASVCTAADDATRQHDLNNMPRRIRETCTPGCCGCGWGPPLRASPLARTTCCPPSPAAAALHAACRPARSRAER